MGFSLPEVVIALMILAFISSTVLVAINRYTEQAIDRQLRIEAFHLARDNMEKILASDTVEETLEYASSDQNPDIQSTSSVETFYEPKTQRMWIKAVCSATYTDSQNEEQTVEFTHWVTDLSVEQVLQVLKVRQWQRTQQALESTTEPTQPTQSGEESPQTSSTPAKNKKYDWLPDDWDSLSKQEQWDWLVKLLFDS